MAQVYFEPDEVWDFYKNESNDTDFVIATDEEFGIEVYISANVASEKPTVCVECYGDPVAERGFSNPEECKEVVSEIYDDCLNGDVQSIISVFDIDSGTLEDDFVAGEIDIDELINKREAEIGTALEEFLEVLAPELSDEVDDIEDVYENITDVVCMYLWKRYEISVFRPMYLVDKNNEPCLEMRPYEEMEI